MEELHLRRKDFRVDWFSGRGGGGQYRNKHQNCCRITHIATGLISTGQSNRDRPSNQREAFESLVRKIINHYRKPEKREISREVIRTYHAERNEVIDKASGFRLPYKQVVVAGDIGPMIEARKSVDLEGVGSHED